MSGGTDLNVWSRCPGKLAAVRNHALIMSGAVTFIFKCFL
jgi:hypothetical protein